jgi:hypothetical protein
MDDSTNLEEPVSIINFDRLSRMAAAGGYSGSQFEDYKAGWMAGVRNYPRSDEDQNNEAYQAGYRAGQKDRK